MPQSGIAVFFRVHSDQRSFSLMTLDRFAKSYHRSNAFAPFAQPRKFALLQLHIAREVLIQFVGSPFLLSTTQQSAREVLWNLSGLMRDSLRDLLA